VKLVPHFPVLHFPPLHFRSCIFHSVFSVLHFPVLHFTTLEIWSLIFQLCRSLFDLSDPLLVPYFPVLHFQSILRFHYVQFWAQSVVVDLTENGLHNFTIACMGIMKPADDQMRIHNTDSSSISQPPCVLAQLTAGEIRRIPFDALHNTVYQLVSLLVS